MPHCLVALGSNLGDREATVRKATAALASIPGANLLARSRWHETPPIGGPAEQGAYLNAAALLATDLAPHRLRTALAEAETRLGRKRSQRWEARAIDLDLLLYDDVQLETAQLVLPHPRMAFRRFVLEPAAETAPWMVHPESGWTVAALLEHLNHAPQTIAVAGADAAEAARRAARLAERLHLPGEVTLTAWNPSASPGVARPKLLIAAAADPGVASPQWRKMLNLPSSGPVAWVGGDSPDQWLHEAVAAVHAVWPGLAS